MCRRATLLDEFALHSATLVAHPMNRGAQAAVRELLQEWRALRKTGDKAADGPVASVTSGLINAADTADAIARATPGYRADLEG